jgi:hypothetical protein
MGANFTRDILLMFALKELQQLPSVLYVVFVISGFEVLEDLLAAAAYGNGTTAGSSRRARYSTAKTYFA